MPTRWTLGEEDSHRSELRSLYIEQNKPIREIGEVLGISEKTVFKRLQRLGIQTNPDLKRGYLNKRKDLLLPKELTPELAEFLGIMFGDGKLSHFQTLVTLGDKEALYAQYVANLISKIFGIRANICTGRNGYHTVYAGSVDLGRWLQQQGLAYNKTASQVNPPRWLLEKRVFIERFLRGFFDTDGSVYKLKFGVQISFTNKSVPLLSSLQSMLQKLEYQPSAISSYKVYLTRRGDIKRFFEEIQPQNLRHIARYATCTGDRAVNCTRL